ncbi:metal ABC transporter solute-binding protein, Zn/Mn family [Corynebacterium sanguinis]|nr:zinc ABC transporter substrate-binding protein [Corynebacterium sanguinis]MCT1554843.1 zinc ABC transporter substrate-binding protein [Corynebacterium sanguinis]MCT1664124.1 zinc ABC transporter substrate-binding protein [Corynebacterium sanguinis]MCT1804259.1 zinc ABC transporter substrate-binding protein [Corynebacterium sanguinis]MCT2158367.1 zinc ABC transporter substrate-binding protein [Corynebacterium sanguinis]
MIGTKSLRAGAAVFATSLFLASCSTGGTDTTTTAASGTPAEAAADTVVATTNVWADVAGSVLGEDVPAVISNPATDPHDFEPAAADLAKVTQAKVLVANGGTYDNAIYKAADPANVISALPLSSEEHDHEHEHEGEHAGHDHAHDENEHIWYDTTVVREVADKLAKAAEDNGVQADTAELNKRLDDVDAKLDALPVARIAQTHPIADSIVENSALEDVTPEDYRQATLNHTEPSSAAVAALITQLENGEVDLLINNPQTPSALTDRILAAAEQNDVPVIDIAETPQGGVDFFDYLDEIANTLTDKLANS